MSTDNDEYTPGWHQLAELASERAEHGDLPVPESPDSTGWASVATLAAANLAQRVDSPVGLVEEAADFVNVLLGMGVDLRVAPEDRDHVRSQLVEAVVELVRPAGDRRPPTRPGGNRSHHRPQRARGGQRHPGKKRRGKKRR